jgi:ACS family hexuronate transporter-like MFS transporter
MTHFRWVVLGLIFLGTTINYLDRMVMGILAPDIQTACAISDLQYGYIQAAFALSYALGQLATGGLLDRVGIRLGYAVALGAWSISSALHAVARGPWGFGIVRALLGVSESPAFPAAAKTVAEWFPKRERAFAFGFVNAGTNLGAILAPAVVPWLAMKYGWQWAFVGTGAVGAAWLLLWLPLYRRPQEHPRVSAAELAHINSDPPEPETRIPWISLLGYRQAWAFAAGKFLTDSMWWFYITWVAKFLHTRHSLDLLHIGLPLVLIYLMADAGSILGGWLSSSMMKRGASVNRARKTAMFVCALGVLPITFAQDVDVPGVRGLHGREPRQLLRAVPLRGPRIPRGVRPDPLARAAPCASARGRRKPPMKPAFTRSPFTGPRGGRHDALERELETEEAGAPAAQVPEDVRGGGGRGGGGRSIGNRRRRCSRITWSSPRAAATHARV